MWMAGVILIDFDWLFVVFHFLIGVGTMTHIQLVWMMRWGTEFIENQSRIVIKVCQRSFLIPF